MLIWVCVQVWVWFGLVGCWSFTSWRFRRSSIRSRSVLLHKPFFPVVNKTCVYGGFFLIDYQCCTLYSMHCTPLVLFLSGYTANNTAHSTPTIIMHGPKCDRLNGWKTSDSALTTLYVQINKNITSKRSYQDEYHIVTACTHSDFIVLPHWENRP